MNAFEVFVPGPLPPSTNTAYRISRGRMYISKEGNDWAEKAALIIGAKHGQNPQEWKGKFLRVSFTFFAKSLLTYDVDGRVKICLDCLSRKLAFDDRYVMELSAQKQKGPEGVHIILEELPPNSTSSSQNATPFPIQPTRINPNGLISELGIPI